jgi:hypothetical protein
VRKRFLRAATTFGIAALCGMGSCRPTNDEESKEGETSVQIVESTVFGKDSVVGRLHVTDSAAYFQSGAKRIRLIQAAPMVAMGSEALMADAARALRPLVGRLVWARGELNGDIMWRVEVKVVRGRP